MFSDISTYGFLNAKIRTRLGKILNEEEIEKLRSDAKYYDIINFLIDKRYINSEDIEFKKDVKHIEYLLFKHLINDYQYIYNSISASQKNVKEYAALMLQRLEISTIKNYLRIWFKKNYDDEPYIYHNKIYSDINYSEILQCESFEEILTHLKKTPYYSYLSNLTNNNTLFEIEFALDKGFYSSLYKLTKKMDKNDQRIVKKFIGYKIDITNLLSLLRYKNYYKLDFNDAIQKLIPFGEKFNTNLLMEIYSNENISTTLNKVVKNIPEYLLNNISEKINKELSLKKQMMLIEDLLNQAILTSIYNTLAGYPFTIGAIVVYFILKDIEIKNLISILNIKYYEE